MTRFFGGPADGCALSLQRSPYFLRVVVDTDKTVDALDQPEDTPKDQERIFLYRIKGVPGVAFLDGRDKVTGKRFGRQEQIAEYELHLEQPDDYILRQTERYHAWVAEQTQEAERWKEMSKNRLNA